MANVRVLLLATTTGYQVRSFSAAADRLGVDLVLGTDRCRTLENPWRDFAIPVRFHDVSASLRAITRVAGQRPFAGVLAVGDRPVPLAAAAAEVLGLPGHPPSAARASGNKLLAREAFARAGLPVPAFTALRPHEDAPPTAVRLPAVVKPLVLSGSRGVIRTDSPEALAAAVRRVRALLQSPDVRALKLDADTILVESYIPGDEYAVEALLEHGRLRVLAIFDKPDPLVGPYFEETIYVTPSLAGAQRQHAIAAAVDAAAAALGLRHGPVHAEVRVDGARVWVLEVGARPIGGLCARALRFTRADTRNPVAFEELLLRHAVGESTTGWQRETEASGVMMIPIPRRGVFRGVEGVQAAESVTHVTGVQITARPDQLLVPLPEGASYLGFIFARAPASGPVEQALREAHRRLSFVIDPALAVV